MLEFHTLDVFTTTPFSGNPLAVVLGADALSTAQMQTIAREFNLSETIFVQAPDDPKHTAKVRIFFPTAEIPFAGHPTIGCAIHLACAARIGDFTAHLVLEEVAGLVPVTVIRVAGHVVAEFTAPVLPYEVKAAVDAQMVANALDLKVGQIGFGHHHACVLQGGPRFLYVPVADTAALAQARPVEPDWSRLMKICEVDSSYCYTPGHQSDFQARMFSPTAGIIEDPATGSASAILAAQLHKSRALTPGTNTFTLLQGIEMGRRSEIGLTIDVDPNGITSVRIKGSAVQISQGKIRIP